MVYPVSKLKTTDYLYKYKSEVVDVERIYRYLDKLHSKQKELIQQISYAHTIGILKGKPSVVFYDVTTLKQSGVMNCKDRFFNEGKHASANRTGLECERLS